MFNVSQVYIDGPNPVDGSLYTWSYLPARFAGVYGTHGLTVTIDGAHVGGSPYDIEVVADAETVQAGATLPGSPADFDAGSAGGAAARVQFEAGTAVALGVDASGVTISAVNAGRRRLQGGGTSVTIMYQVQSMEDLTSVFAGSGFGAALVAGINAAGSTMATLSLADLVLIEPVRVATYATDPAQCTASGPALAGSILTVGEANEFTIQFVNEFGIAQRASTGESVQVDVVNGTNSSRMGALTSVDGGDGSSSVTFAVEGKGSFEVIVKVNYVHVVGSPFSVTVRSGLAVPTWTYMTPAVGSLLEVDAGATTMLTVVPIDSGGNREDYGLDLNSTRVLAHYRRSATELVSIPMQSAPVDGESQFTGNVREVAAGTYVLEITLHGQPVQASPFQFAVGAGAPVAAHFLTAGTGLAGTVAGTSQALDITPRDEFLNAIAAPGLAVSETPSGHALTCAWSR